MKSTLLIFQLFFVVTCWVRAHHDMDYNWFQTVPYVRKGSMNRIGFGPKIRSNSLPKRDENPVINEPKSKWNLSNTFKRVCYLRMDPSTNFWTRHIDGDLCTHLIYAFCRFDPASGNILFGADSDEQYIKDTAKVKRKYPHLKLMVSIYNDENRGFNTIVGNKILSRRVARESIKFMDKYSFDGLDLDWEFPGFPNKNKTETSGYTTIIAELRKAFGQKYLLTVATPAQERVFAGYELFEISKQVDWLNVMTYDYHMWQYFTPLTGPNAPLYTLSGVNHVPIAKHLSINWTVHEYINQGVPREKIVLGIPTYSRGFKLAFLSDPEPFRPSTGHYVNELKDYLIFPEVCRLLSLPGTKTGFDSQGRVPYLSTPDKVWVSYEDEYSLKEKVNFIIQHQLGGYMTWNLNSDNFDGPCMKDETRNILHKTLLNAWGTYRKRMNGYYL